MLMSLLESARQYNPMYLSSHGFVYSTHLPMALTALHRLGASDRQLQNLYDRSTQHLLPMPAPRFEIEVATLEAFLGDTDAIAEWQHFFQGEYERLGRDVLLTTYLSQFCLGLASHAFHPIIRINYGLDIGDDAEVVMGLAYLAATYAPLNPVELLWNGTASMMSAIEALQTLSKTCPLDFTQPTIYGRMQDVASQTDYVAAISQVKIDENSLKHIAETVLTVYLATGDFAALHLVTGTQALRRLMPYVSDKVQVLQSHWFAVACAYVGIGCPGVAPIEVKVKPWPELQKLAIESMEDHSIKLTYSCQCEQEYYDDQCYQLAASLRLAKKG